MCNIQRIISQNLSKQTPSHLPQTPSYMQAPSYIFLVHLQGSYYYFPSHKDWRNSFSHHLDLPIEGAVAGGIVLGEGTLQGIHHSNVLGGKGRLQPPGSDTPARHSPQSRARLLWLSNRTSLRPHTKTRLWCWCCHHASGAGRQQGASGSCRRDGTLASREKKNKNQGERSRSLLSSVCLFQIPLGAKVCQEGL